MQDPSAKLTSRVPGQTTPGTWLLDKPLLRLADAERDQTHDWTLRDAFEGVQIFGATGSGKTSGSGQALALGFLRSDFGGLVLTAKPDLPPSSIPKSI